MLTCFFCRAFTPDVATAIDLDWVPSFYDHPDLSDDEVCEPCCPECAEKYLVVGDSGELELSDSAVEV